MKTKTKIIAVTVILSFSLIIALTFFVRNSTFTNVKVESTEMNEIICTKYLTELGWKISDHPIEVCEITIPQEFNSTYTNYNEIQQKQGFNLKKYRGKNCSRFTYSVLNYKGTPYGIRANILLFNGKIIGSDICSVELDGFMHESTLIENQL